MGIEELLLDRARKEGFAEGFAKGLAEARAETSKEQKRVVRNLKNLGIAIEIISKGTRLSVQEIEVL